MKKFLIPLKRFFGFSNDNPIPPPIAKFLKKFPFAAVLGRPFNPFNIKSLNFARFLNTKVVAARNGFLTIFVNANFTARPAKVPIVPMIFVIPTVSPTPIAAKIPKSVRNFLLNSFNLSILPSEPNLINVNILSVNHPPARISKKLVNLLSIPCAKVATFVTGDNNAT